MNVEKDFREFIALLNKYKVRYLIIGGFAFSYYAEPRFTKDIDILIDSEGSNAKNLILAIQDFGFKDIELTSADFLTPSQVIQLGIAPLRIDLLTVIKGLDFLELWHNRTTGKYGNIETFFISKQDLIKSKRLSGRKQDLADIEKLEQI